MAKKEKAKGAELELLKAEGAKELCQNCVDECSDAQVMQAFHVQRVENGFLVEIASDEAASQFIAGTEEDVIGMLSDALGVDSEETNK